jgi:hypothetical protein
MCNNDEREGEMISCDDPQSLRHAQVLFFQFYSSSFIWLGIFSYNSLLEGA